MAFWSEILDKCALEFMITFNREDDFTLPGFKTDRVERKLNNIEWEFVKDYEAEDVFESGVVTIPSWCGVKDAVRFYSDPGIKLIDGDRMCIKYELTWWWEGPGDNTRRSPTPMPGATLTFYFTAA